MLRVVVPEFARGDVECDEHVAACVVAGDAHGLEHELDGLAIGREAWREPALISNARGEAAFFQQ